MRKKLETWLSGVPFLHRRLDHHMREVVAGALVAFVIRGGGALAGFGFNLVLAKRCGAEGVGLYYLALAVVSVGTVFGRLGMDNVLLKSVAANSAVGSWEAVKGVYSKGTRVALVCSFISSLAVFFLAPVLSDKVFHKLDLCLPLRWMAFSIVPVSLFLLYAEMLKGLKRIGDSMFVGGFGLSLFSLLAVIFWNGHNGVLAGVGSYDLAAVLTLASGALLWRLATPHLESVRGFFRTEELFRSSLPLFWVASMSLVISWISTFALGVWGTKQEVGILGAATRTSMLITLVLMAVNSISAPKYAVFYKTRDMRAMDLTARKSTKLMTLCVAPALIFTILFPGYIMGFFGEEFRTGASTLVILALGQFVNVATGSVGYILTMSGNERLARNRTFLIVFLSVGLNLILVPHYKLMGAAISSAVCTAASNLISVYFVWTKLGVWTLPFVSPGKPKW